MIGYMIGTPKIILSSIGCIKEKRIEIKAESLNRNSAALDRNELNLISELQRE